MTAGRSSPRLARLASLAGLLPALGLWTGPGPTAPIGAGQADGSPAQGSSPFSLAGLEVHVEGELGPFELTVTTRSHHPGVEIATLRLTSSTVAAPPQLTLRWSMPAHDVHGQWNTGARFDKGIDADWGPTRVRSMLSRHAPVMTLFGADDGNRLTFAVSDALNEVELTAGVREENGRVVGTIGLFREPHRALQQVEVEVRFDRREVPFQAALGDVVTWWAAQPDFTPAAVPEAARLPMYSTWYSYHQSVSAEALLGEVSAARELGYEAIIIDDGWQTLDSRRGYAYTGDWSPERMPQMRQFVEAAHQRGMKVLLWYSLPLVGEHSAVFRRFEGKYLRYWDGQGAYVLDPRYPEVRSHVIHTYRRAIREWGIDGFKLDFLGFLVANDATELTAVEGRDYASVNEATDRLMTDIMGELRAVKSDILIEFRQPYIGPLMRKYGNMFRAGDAPNAAVDNRVRTVDLRLLSGKTAVHSDMFMWHPEESVEVAALQILNILFAVPQLSVRLGEIPDAHLEMVRFYTDYWRRNRDVLLDGAFEPRAPLSNYPMVSAHNGRKRIVALYQDMVVDLGASEATAAIDIVNATDSGRVVLNATEMLGSYWYVVRDAQGRQGGTGSIELSAGPHMIQVPPSGLLSLSRNPPTRN